MNVFIAGPRAVSRFDDMVVQKLHSIYEKNFTVLVGDASGVDSSTQKYFFELEYSNLIVYASNGTARNNIGNWQVEKVVADSRLKGFEFYTQKDIAMADKADCGFMIWNGESKGTLNNILNLISRGKQAIIYFIPQKKIITFDDEIGLKKLIEICPLQTKKMYSTLSAPKLRDATDVQLNLWSFANDNKILLQR